MSPPRFVHKKISAQEFTAELERQGMSVPTFTRLWCQNLSKVSRWASGYDDIPAWVPIALSLMTLEGGVETARVAAAAMIEQDRLRPELGSFPYQTLRSLPADAEHEDA